MRRGLWLLAVVAACFARVGSARASSFEGRLAVGPSYMWNDTKINDSQGPALSLQADAGLRLRGPFALVATIFYDRSSWLAIDGLTSEKEGSVLGFGLGGSLRFGGWLAGVAAGGQFTAFPQSNDPSDTYAASLGPFLSISAGYTWGLSIGTHLGVVTFFRTRRSKDETNSFVYDPVGHQLGIGLVFGLDGEPLAGS
jgi:hypothetical protein